MEIDSHFQIESRDKSPLRVRKDNSPLRNCRSNNSPARRIGNNSPLRNGRDYSPLRNNRINNGNNSPSRNENSPSRRTNGRRIRSLDNQTLRRSNALGGEDIMHHSSTGDHDIRACSTGDSPNLMKSLMFEKTDLGNTPLSSLRSCSEYNRWSLHPTEQKSDNPEPESRSYYGYFLSYFYTPSKPKNRVRFRDSKEDQVFLISNLRFNEANLLEGEDYNYRTDPSISPRNSRSSMFRFSSLFGGSSSNSNSSNERNPSNEDSRNSSTDSTSCASMKKSQKKKKKRPKHNGDISIIDESLHTIEYIFGFGPRNKDLPMEIELREFSPPQILTVYTEDINGIVPSIDNTHVHHDEAYGIRRVTSLGTFGRLRSESSDSNSYSSRPSTPRSGLGLAHVIVFNIYDRATWRPYIESKICDFRDHLRFNYSSHFRSEDFFYECLRIQPFSSGSYLRAMLVAGFCSTVFNIYNIVCWPQIVNMNIYHYILIYFLYITLTLQTIVHLIQLPVRLQVHFQCWETSRVIEVDRAIDVIRRMLASDSWLLNRMLGYGLDVSTIAILIVTEVYLWMTTHTDPLRALVISLGATNIMTVVMRVTVATIFALSMHDPQVLSEARRRGLSKWDLAVLPAFVYSNPNDVNNPECSICLGTFEMGEMLTSLPCDKKHSFHSACIRQWLERQNSCPLCQKMV